MQKRTTLKEIAEATGYGVSTVSMALRDHTKIPEETRKRIQKTAEEMGYQRDPMLSALAAYRDSHRVRNSWRGGIVALTLNRDWTWHAIPFWENVLAAMKEEAEVNGYSLNEMSLDRDDRTPQRQLDILAARGITGLVLQSAESFPFDALDWSRFSVISLGVDPSRGFHTVASDFFRSAMGCVRQAIDAGYRRLGLALPEGMMDPRHYREMGAFLAHKSFHPELEFFFLEEQNNDYELRTQWIAENRIDLVIGNVIEFATAPDGSFLPFLNLNVREPRLHESGYRHPPSLLGATLIQQLHSQIIRGEKGVPEYPLSIQVSGQWQPGNTFDPKPITK